MARTSGFRAGVVRASLLVVLPSAAAAAPAPLEPLLPVGTSFVAPWDVPQGLVGLVVPLGSTLDPDGATSAPPSPPTEDRSGLGSRLDPNG